MPISVIIMGAAGRMGSMLFRQVSESDDLQVCAVVERPGHEDKLPQGVPASTDLAETLPRFPGATIIDFTSPESSMRNAALAAAHGTPIVIGTTGLSAGQKKELEGFAAQTPLFFSPNMSMGINVLMSVLPLLAKMLEGYDMEVMEIHHKHKKDSPSGTALLLAEALANAREWDLADSARYCREGIIGERPEREIGIQTLRGGDVVGVHTTYFMGPGERIEITHQAHSRDNFANGALKAVRWLAGQKPGRLYTMGDVLQAQ